MMHGIKKSHFLPLIIVVLAILTACGGDPVPPAGTDDAASPAAPTAAPAPATDEAPTALEPTPEAPPAATPPEEAIVTPPAEADDIATTAPETAHPNLARAASAGDLDDVLLHIQLGADVNAANETGVAALHNARTAEIALALIDKGADLDAKTGANWTPLHYAIIRARGDVAEALLEKGADANIADSAGMTPLFHAVSRGVLSMTRLLVENGADMAAQDQTGWTPLHHAAQKNQVEVAAYLLDQGADIHARSHGGGQPIHEAIGTSKEMIDLLVAKGADVQSKTNEDKTALDYATELGDEETIAILKAHGAE